MYEELQIKEDPFKHGLFREHDSPYETCFSIKTHEYNKILFVAFWLLK